jgi:hypothetical protein
MTIAHIRSWFGWFSRIGVAAIAGTLISTAIAPSTLNESRRSIAKAEKCLPHAEDGSLFFDPGVIPIELMEGRVGLAFGPQSNLVVDPVVNK